MTALLAAAVVIAPLFMNTLCFQTPKPYSTAPSATRSAVMKALARAPMRCPAFVTTNAIPTAAVTMVMISITRRMVLPP